MKVEFKIDIEKFPELEYLSKNKDVLVRVIKSWLAYIFEVDIEDIEDLQVEL